MKSISPGITTSKGFTLVEVIITILIASVLGAMLVPYLGKAFTQSSKPIQYLAGIMELKSAIENITDSYRQSPADLSNLKTAIGAEGTSQNNTLGVYEVVTNEYIKFTGYNDTPISTGDPENLLKVTIRQPDTDATLTTLFAQQ